MASRCMEGIADCELQEMLPIGAGEDCYFPLATGRYEVKPGLMPFGTDFGNGVLDQQVSFRDCATIRQDENLRSHLCAAVRSMSQESLVYSSTWIG